MDKKTYKTKKEQNRINTGAYMILAHLENDSPIRIGHLGTYNFSKGFYIYVGSAMNGLAQRIGRHKRPEKKMHWHIDYFLKVAKIKKICAIQSGINIECNLSRKILSVGDEIPVPRFGSSDCKCRAHLYFFRKNPAVSGKLRQAIKAMQKITQSNKKTAD